MKRKLVLVAIGVVLGLGTSAVLPHSRPVELQTKLSSTVVAPKSTPAQTQVAQTAVSDEVATTQQTTEQPTTPVKPSVTPQQPDYGQDPSNPKMYTVFNKSKIMIEVGIPSDQQAAADTLITDLMNWHYEVTGMDADLCYIVPLIKMESAGSDYRTNPVTQLTYCNQLAQTRYGGWNQALAKYEAHPTYGFFD